jgi:hypothetical protein
MRSPIISTAIVAAIGVGDVFSKGRDFGAWLGPVPGQISTGDRTILGSLQAWQSLCASRSFRRSQSCWSGSGQNIGKATASSLGARRRRSDSTTTFQRSRHCADQQEFARIAWAVLNKGRTFACANSTRWRPVRRVSHTGLGAVEAWPGGMAASGKARATASLRGPLRAALGRAAARHEQRNRNKELSMM